MPQATFFPYMHVANNGVSFEGSCGIVLSSILKGDLLSDAAARSDDKDLRLNPADPKSLQQARDSFLRAISCWPSSTVLELHFSAQPDLMHRARGRVYITMLIRASATCEEAVKEELVSRYLSLMPLLSAYFGEAEFTPITDGSLFKERAYPFTPTFAYAICRKEEYISLSTPLARASTGFLAGIKCPAVSHGVSHKFPWVPSFDGWARLIGLLTGQLDPIQIAIRIRPGASTEDAASKLLETVGTCESFLASLHDSQLALVKHVTLIRDVTMHRLAGLAERCFNVGAFILAPHPVDPSLANVLGMAITGKPPYQEDKGIFQGAFSFSEIAAHEAVRSDFFAEPEPFSSAEAACAFRLPSPPFEDVVGLNIKRSRTSLGLLPAVSKDSGGIKLFMNVHKGLSQPVYAQSEDRMRHTFILGQTGTGKSTLIESMALQDIVAGRGVAVIDPHGDMVDNILARIPKRRVEDVILFDLLDKRPVGFNIIQWDTPEERDLIIDELYLTLDRIYDMKLVGGPMFEANFRAMLKLLMGDGSKGREDFIPTLLDFISCYQNDGFRGWLKSTMSDRQVLDFVDELETAGGECSLRNVSPYITSKFSRFMYDTTLKRIIGQGKTAFDFSDIMDSGKIFLVKLRKGRFGHVVGALLSNMLVSRFKLAAMKRGDVAIDQRRDFYLYVDEAHNLPQENFTELLSEARKYRLSLLLSTQFCSQLADPSKRGNDLLSAITGNVGTTVIFRLGSEDATQMARVLDPYFSSRDIIGLPNWQGYVRMNLNQEPTPPFSFITEKVAIPADNEMASYIRELSSMKYGMDAAALDRFLLDKQQKLRDLASNS